MVTLRARVLFINDSLWRLTIDPHSIGMETFFRIGYSDQVPVGVVMWIVGLEAVHFLIEIAFSAYIVFLR